MGKRPRDIEHLDGMTSLVTRAPAQDDDFDFETDRASVREQQREPVVSSSWRDVVFVWLPVVALGALTAVALYAGITKGPTLDENSGTVYGTSSTTVAGEEFTTNYPLSVYEDTVFVTVPVGTDMSTVSVEVRDPGSTILISEQLAGIDTSKPGEHEVPHANSDLRVIVEAGNAVTE